MTVDKYNERENKNATTLSLIRLNQIIKMSSSNSSGGHKPIDRCLWKRRESKTVAMATNHLRLFFVFFCFFFRFSLLLFFFCFVIPERLSVYPLWFACVKICTMYAAWQVHIQSGCYFIAWLSHRVRHGQYNAGTTRKTKQTFLSPMVQLVEFVPLPFHSVHWFVSLVTSSNRRRGELTKYPQINCIFVSHRCPVAMFSKYIYI